MTAITTPEVPTNPVVKLGWVLADSWTLTLRGLAHWVRNPTQILAGLAFPILMVLLFGGIFGSGMQIEGGGDYMEFLMPGMFVMSMAFGIGETMAGVTADASKGVTDRFRSMPVSAASVVIGQSIVNMLYSTVVLAILVGCGAIAGWSRHDGFAQALGGFALLLLRFALLWVGIYLGLIISTPEAASAVYTLLFPLGIVANTFASPEMMPAWLAPIAAWNPLSSTAHAIRELFGNPGVGGTSWIAEHAMLMSFVWPLAILLLFFPLAVRKYRALSR
ncbi:ABC transporter permease [Streptomyces sp. HNM0645]|uniref:ABC transporter permease n=1 Tax=Streptomyces sp. HNM0645 TaxID=2782343 RepID=UPI0024B70D0A|nr:ABC transporter permease [Streptomyces sp. HNM0645]MDI9886154.1 ABC transporter permease [Streptomyces sp. HNM0645]